MVLLQKLADGLGRAPDGVGFPRAVNPRGLGLVEPGSGVVGVEADDEGGDAKGADTA